MISVARLLATRQACHLQPASYRQTKQTDTSIYRSGQLTTVLYFLPSTNCDLQECRSLPPQLHTERGRNTCMLVCLLYVYYRVCSTLCRRLNTRARAHTHTQCPTNTQ